MNNQPFYIGQEVVCINEKMPNPDTNTLKSGHTYVVASICDRFPDHIDIKGHERALSGKLCSFHVKHFAPIERIRTKYVEKQVEVAPAIKELEKCLS